jgi:choline-sulfatase
VLGALRHVGQNLDDWIIIYTSDHGEMLGEHGIWEKQKFFEASARVPLIVRWPKRFKPRVVEENVNLCDLFATLCDLSGIPSPPGLDSRSMVPLMDGDAADWRHRYHNETVSQFGGRNLMIKRDHLKYQWYGADLPEVLFDLQSDPGERRNALDDPQHAGAVRGFRQRRDELGFAPGGLGRYVNAGYAAAT